MPARSFRPGITLVALVALLLVPKSAAGHGELEPVSAAEEGRLRAFETAALGAEHAREHALGREAARRRAARVAALSPAARRELERQARAESRRLQGAAQASVAGLPLAEVGRWSPRYGLPDYVMSAALLHTGEVAMWGWLPYGPPGSDGVSRRPLRGENWFWDSSRPLPGLLDEQAPADAFRRDDAPAIDIGGRTQTPPLYCSGVSFLPDGRLVIAGGNLAFTEEDPENGRGWKGLDTLFVYDPATGDWTRGPTMERGRWYPTQVMLPDGRTWIAGGYDELGEEAYVPDAELLSAAATSLSRVPAPATVFDDTWGEAGWPGLYPHAWVMPGGQLLVVPREWSRASALFDPVTLGYEPDRLEPYTQRPEKEGATAVLMPEAAGPSHSVMQLGGFAYYGPDGVSPDGMAAPTVRTLDHRRLGDASPWAGGPPLKVGRSYHNTVLLPGGEIVTVGGGAGTDPDPDPDTTSGLYWDGGGKPELLNAELFDPLTSSWSLGAAQQSFRAYHSVALLLPDGRVWSAGDDWHQDRTRDETGSPWRGNAEIYSPPYLFGGADPASGAYDPNRAAQRTEIAGAPRRLAWGDEAEVTTSSDDVARMVLVAPSAVTHSIDTNQRHVTLEIVGRTAGQGVRVRLPGDATTTPPGWYMMFALNRCGTPSHASWVRIGGPLAGDPPAGAPASPPALRSGPALCGPTPPVTPPSAAPELVPPAVSTPGEAPPASSSAAAVKRRLLVERPRATRRELLKRRQIVLYLRLSGGARVKLHVLLARSGFRSVTLGRRSLTVRRAGRVKVGVRLTRSGLAALRRPGRVTLVVNAAAGPNGRATARRRL